MSGPSPDSPRRIVKLGGSLLDLPDLVDRLRDWLAQQPPALNILLVGGGPLADAIRAVDRIHCLGEDPAHWLCIRAMSLAAEMVAGLFDEMDLIRQYDALRSLALVPRSVVFDAEPFLRDVEPSCPGCPLPHNWHTTSDSIAARVAIVLDAAELVLLKSSSQPAGDFEEAARQAYVDNGFPLACRDVRAVRFVNLRG